MSARKALKYIRPINFYRSDYAYYKRISEGPMTSHKLLEIDYGHFPPKGLEIDKKNNNMVEVNNPMQDPDSSLMGKVISSVLTAGYVKSKQKVKSTSLNEKGGLKAEFDRTIYLNHLLYSPVGQALAFFIGYKIGGDLVTALSQPEMIQSTVDFVKDRWFLGMLFLSSLRHTPLAGLISMAVKPAMMTIGHEHVHILQVYDSQENKTGFNIMKNHFKNRANNARGALSKSFNTLDRIASIGLVGYYQHDFEIQARMHNVLVRNYEKWGRMPTTKHEFWAAMIDGGLNAPKVIHEKLKNSKDGRPQDFLKNTLSSKFNRAAIKLYRPDVVELNVATRSLFSPKLKEQHWEETLPYLYGHLLELYGHKKGRMQMGFSGPFHQDGSPVPYPMFESNDNKEQGLQKKALGPNLN
jgi:hypothetical protein